MTPAVIDDYRTDAVEPLAALAEQQGAVQLMLDLEAAGAVTLTALTIYDPNLPFEKAASLAAFLGSMTRRCGWYIPDLLLYSEQIYPDTWPQIAHYTGLTEQTLLFRMSVARRIPPERRRAELSFSSHALVATKRADEQAYWLHEAAQNGWGYAALRDALRRAAQQEQPPLFNPDPPPREEVEDDRPFIDLGQLLDAARSLVTHAQADGPGWVKVPIEDYTRLTAALGMEE